ncbi:MAG: hypothetical protein KAI59_06095 [Planctomycetes bacterium]|nr:hypothetical protein [Planctomycetota bacterium]
MKECESKVVFSARLVVCALLAILFLSFPVQADVIISYEPSEIPPLSITSGEVTPTVVQGGISGAPDATDGNYILKCTWTNQPGGKVEIKHTGLNFDLDDFNGLLADIYLTSDLFAGSSNGLIGIYDTAWTGDWYPAMSIPDQANQWHAVVFDVSANNQTGLTGISAFLLENMTSSSGTFYLDNFRLVTQIPMYRLAENPSSVEQGLRYKYFAGIWDKLPEFEILEFDEKGFIDNFDITSAAAADNFGYSFCGYIDVPADGNYIFYTQSDDGSELYIGNNLIVANDGLHASTEKSGSIELQAGKHAITVNYFDNTGSEELIVSYEGPTVTKTAIPNNVLYREILSGDYDDNSQVDFCDLASIAMQWLTSYTESDLGLIADNWLEGTSGLHVKNGWYYFDNEKFFVKGIGYEPGSRPYQYPWSRTYEPEVITMDMNRILDAGFNTIRTWGELTEQEVQLIDSMGLKIIFGIWIDPAGDFGDSAFITAAENSVRSTLGYTKNYDSIITYLIMNEPLPSHIYDAGAAETVYLWDRIKTIINAEHPGVPVSFANTGVGEFINMNMFDVSTYNLYMYAPGTVKEALKYAGYVEELKSASLGNPLIITEYGLSVSPSGPGSYGYGGNSLTEQTDGDLYMYRSLIDGGAQGGCVFSYLDGWWKNNETPNDADTHDDEAEEWFGLVGIDDETSDPNGTPRPVWYAMKEYNTAIVTSPKNGQIYDANIPLEIFPQSNVKTIRIKKDLAVIYEQATNGKSYIEDTLVLSIAEPIKDVNLVFEFLDNTDTVIKTENIIILYAQSEPTLPGFVLSVPLNDLNSSSTCAIEITVDNQSSFTIKDSTVNYVFYPHLGWDAGTDRTAVLTSNPQTISDSYTVSSSTNVLTVSAGFTIEYGQFEKRLYRQKIIQRGDWANPLCRKEIRN